MGREAPGEDAHSATETDCETAGTEFTLPTPPGGLMLLLEWTADAVDYRLTALTPDSAVITALGPGMGMRAAAVPLGAARLVDWLTMSDMERTAQAEGALDEAARSP